jgi:hypothetical protein
MRMTPYHSSSRRAEMRAPASAVRRAVLRPMLLGSGRSTAPDATPESDPADRTIKARDPQLSSARAVRPAKLTPASTIVR